MEKIIAVGLDLAKSIFQVHGIAEKRKVSSHIAAIAGSALRQTKQNGRGGC